MLLSLTTTKSRCFWGKPAIFQCNTGSATIHVQIIHQCYIEELLLRSKTVLFHHKSTKSETLDFIMASFQRSKTNFRTEGDFLP